MKMPSEVKPSLREARERLGLTQQAMAEKLGVTQPTVSRVESGETTPRQRHLRRWADAYGVELDMLVPEATSEAA
jgi:transcriptional regulator with XRE-family HTH domain